MLLSLPEYYWNDVFKFLDSQSLWKMTILSPIWAEYIGNSSQLLLKHQLLFTPKKCEAFIERPYVSKIPYRNILIQNIKGYESLRKFKRIIKKLKATIEILELVDFKRNQIQEILDFFQGFSKLRILKIKNCAVCEEITTQQFSLIKSLKEVEFEKCDGNIFKLFHGQKEIIKITVRNFDWTWNGFPHDDFNDLAKSLPNIDTIVMSGIGTGSYFDCDHYPYKIRRLDATIITFHWYVGIRTARTAFLEAQKSYLKELVIHELPYDFDGEGVLRFIIEQMNLDKFYLKDTPLILNKQIQPVQEITVNEIQISSLFEMFRKFRSIKSLKLNLTQTDVSSSDIENLINPTTDLFHNAENLEIYDNSGYRRILGIFLGLFKNFVNIRCIKIQSQDGNINVLLQEFLPSMTNLREIYIDSKAPGETDRLNIIRNNVTNLTKLWVPAEYVQQSKNLFGVGVEVQEVGSLASV